MLKRIRVDDLQPGMVIVQITAQNGPVRIRKSGLVSSQEMVQGLKEMGVQELEIDTAQTVELESTYSVPTASSPTKTLLMQGAQQANVDHKLSEHFNRSLFLPSVQSLPGRWHYYGRKTLVAALVLFGGMGLGYTAAVMPWQQLLAPKEAPTVVMVAEQPKNAVPSPALETEPTPVAEEAPQTALTPENTLTQAEQLEEAGAVPVDVLNTDAEVPLDSVSPELLRRFRQAVSETEQSTEEHQTPSVAKTSQTLRVDQLPAWVLAELPSMSFSTHLYASVPTERRVRVNGVELGEGDWISDNLRIVRIEPQKVILTYKGQEFSLPALGEW